jgi:Ca2+-binding EF-hand superfamily protein
MVLLAKSERERPPASMFCREQIYVDAAYVQELKRLEKASIRFVNAGFDVDHKAYLEFCRDWFNDILHERRERREREEAWRREWSGKKGEVKAMFDAIDTDHSGSIDYSELDEALERIPDFFGYSGSSSSESKDEVGAAPAGMHDWLEDQVAEHTSGGAGSRALFQRLDLDGSGTIEWDEFWEVIGEWMDTGFNRLEELQAEELERERERARIAEEEARRRRVKEEQLAAAAAAAEAALQARLAEEERRRKLLEAQRLAQEERARKEAEREERRRQLAEIEAQKAEEAHRLAEEEAAAAAMDDAERLRRRSMREAAAAQEAATAARVAEEERLRLEAEAAAAAAREAQLERWAAAVAAAVAVGEEALRSGDPLAIGLMCREMLWQLAVG